jgi:FtsZ-interacting cell division protein ZipA
MQDSPLSFIIWITLITTIAVIALIVTAMWTVSKDCGSLGNKTYKCEVVK